MAFVLHREGALDVLTVDKEQWPFFEQATFQTPGRFLSDERRAVGSTLAVGPVGGHAKMFRVARCTPYGSGFMVGVIPA